MGYGERRPVLRNTGSFDDWLAQKDIGLAFDSFSKVHEVLLEGS
jgi:hypothetical protein